MKNGFRWEVLRVSHEKHVANVLLSIKAITLNIETGYRWASGIIAPIYCDNRLVMSYPEKRAQIRDFFIDMIKMNNIECDIVAGVATSGIPHAAWLADKLNKPMIYVRAEAKDHGKQNRIEGRIVQGQKVLVVEDLVSTGGSSISAVEAVREAGGVVECCLAIFTYELEESATRFREAQCRLFTLSNFNTLVDVAVKEGYLKEQEREQVLEWSHDPKGWGKRRGLE